MFKKKKNFEKYAFRNCFWKDFPLGWSRENVQWDLFYLYFNLKCTFYTAHFMQVSSLFIKEW